jgi:anti-sigma B factor antagonist
MSGISGASDPLIPTEAPGRTYFRIEESDEPDSALRLQLIGELDLLVADRLTARLHELKLQRRYVRLDLGGLRFIDSSGLRAVILAVSDARSDGAGLEVSREVSDAVRRVIDIVGVGPHLWPINDG